MTIASQVSRVSYSGNGSTTVFSFPYYFIDDSDLVVILKSALGVETTQIITTNYTVSGEGSSSGGDVTMLIAPASGSTLVIYRAPSLTQETDFVENDSLPAESLERELDKSRMIDQRLSDRIDRSVRLTEAFSASFDPTLPSTLTANATLVVNADGDGFSLGATTTEIEDASAEASAAAASAVAAANSATLASQWATKTDDDVASSGEYSAKEYAQGVQTGTGGSAKDWALETATDVDSTGEYSSKEYAIGTQRRGAANGGSSKDWATYTGGTVNDTEYSAKYYADQAASSASDAAAAASASQWSDVVYVSFADSPVAVSDASAGMLYAVDASGGAVVFNLPSISSLSLSTAWSFGIKKTDSSANSITANRDGTDTIDGGTSKVITRQYSGASFIPDTDGSPDNWTSLSFGEVPITGSIVGTSDAQTLTNKTFDDELILQELGSTPSTPASGYKAIYPKTDGKLYTLDDAGIEIEVGSGGAGGGIQYIDNTDFETDATGYSAYADAAGTSPVDGTGGSANITIARSTTDPLRGTAHLLLTKDAANRQGQGFSYDFTIDLADTYKNLYISFDYLASTDYADDDIKVFIYDVTNAQLISVTQNGVKDNANPGLFSSYFLASDSLSYRLIVHISSTNASAYTLKFDNFSVSPNQSSAALFPGVLAAKLTIVGTVNHTSNGNWQNIAFDTVELNSSDMVSGSTVVITEAGYYFCQASIGFNAAVGSGQGVRFTINGTADTRSEISSSTFSSKYNVQQMYYLEIDDVVAVQGLQTSGGTVAYDNTFDTSLSVFKISGGGAATSSRAFQEIKYDTRAGFGSTNTQIPYFTNTTFESQEGDLLFTAANSATLGASFTVLRDCKMTMIFTAAHTGTGEVFGISRNAVTLNSAGTFKTASNSIRMAQALATTDSPVTVTMSVVAAPGDVFRPHSNNPTALGTAAYWSVVAFAELNNVNVISTAGGGGGGGAADFTDLGDVPSSYTGEALKLVRVNAAENALEFTAPVSGISGLTDNRMVKADGTSAVQNTGFTIDDSNIIDFQPGQIHSTIQTLTDGANISWNLNANQISQVTLEGNRTLDNPTNLKSGAYYTLIVKQDATGSRTLAYGTAYKFFGGITPVLSTAANAVDIISFISDGTNMFGSIQRGFA